MSLVVAIRTPDRGVFVGADSAIISGSDEHDQTITSISPELNPKIMKRGPYVAAGVGSARILNVLRLVEWPELPPEALTDLEVATKHVVAVIVPVVLNTYEENGLAMEQIPGAMIYHGQFVLAFGNYLFDIGPDLSAVTYDIPYIALGGAAKLATGALGVATELLDDPVEQIKMAMSTASFHSTMCCAPFTILHTLS